jgi:polar amino acid transport system substrate-binding protein
MLIACQGGSDETALERIQREGVVRVGYANEAPYAFMDSAQGKLTGEAPEILRAVMDKLGVDKVEGVLTEFGALIPGLKARRFDIIAAGMYITPQRCEQIAFSDPTYVIGEAFIVETGNPLGLHSYENVREHDSATIGVMAGAVEHGYAKDLGIPAGRIIVFPDNVSGLDGVRSGRVDAFAATSLTVNDLLSKTNDDRVEMADPFTDPVIDGESVRGYGAFGFRPEDSALREAFNAELAGFLGTPEHLDLVRPFGFTEDTIPQDVTAAQLCGV